MSKILTYIRRQSFNPDLAGLFVNPFYFIRKELHRNIKSLAPHLKGDLLDFGCGRKPYEQLFHVNKYIGIDMEQTGHEHKLSKVDVYYDGQHIPFKENTFDSVFCSEVFEHVFNLDEVLKEIHRVLIPDGKILVTVPFCWHEHEVPYDFGRYTSYGIKHIMEKNGFKVLEYRKSGNFVRVNFQLWANYFFYLIKIRHKTVRYLLSMALTIPVNVVGALLIPLFPINTTLYFNNVVLAKKVIPRNDPVSV